MDLRTPPSTEARIRLRQGNWRHIAKIAGCTPIHVGRVLKGIRGCSLHTAADIACAADVTLDDLYKVILESAEFERGNRRLRGVHFQVINPKAEEATRKQIERQKQKRMGRDTLPQSRGTIAPTPGSPVKELRDF